MSEANYKPARRRMDGIGCVGSLFLFTIMLFIMGAVLGGARTQASELPPTLALPTRMATAEALARITDTPMPTLPPTNTPQPSPTQPTAMTPSPTLPPPTATMTRMPTETAVPDTPTPLPTATSTPLPLPTPHEVYSWTLKVPILMYHYISIPPEDADKYRIDLSVAPDNFREQMAYLANNGYTTIDFEDLSRAIADKQDLPDKPVIITLDDGYRDNYENAFPVLKEFGLTATIFLPTEFIDRGGEAYMTWEMIEEMSAAGIYFAPHTKSHIDLRGQSRDTLIWQILGSQETIAAHVGYTPRYFSYPSGRYDENTVTILKELDFWGAVTTLGGKWHGFEDRYEWTRLRVHNYTVLSEFIDLVAPVDTVGGKRVAGE